MAKRDYQNDYPSVTQVLGILRKPGLENWFKFNTAQFCNAESAKGRLIGTQIHEAIQSHIELQEVKIETQYPDEVMTALKGFMLFKKEHSGVKLEKSELILTSEKYKYNGTLDCVGDIGVPIIFDWKTGKCKEKTKPPIYDEYIYQVAAYVYAYNEQEKANIQEAIILALAKDKIAYNLLHLTGVELQEAMDFVFKPALSIYNYQKKGR